MLTSRYTEAEMNQWDESCPDRRQAEMRAHPQHAHASKAKGQAERSMARAGTNHNSMTRMQANDDWASECLFDCYNS